MSRFARHSDGRCEVHNLSVIAMNNFVRTMRQQIGPIDQPLNNLLRQHIPRNSEIMGFLFTTVIFCGRNNIALRGRPDDDPSNENRQGNFQALLALQGHLNTAPRKARYISKTIQNEMITTVGKYISNNLSREVRESKMKAYSGTLSRLKSPYNSTNTIHLKVSLKQLKMSQRLEKMADQGRHLNVIFSWLISKKRIMNGAGGCLLIPI